MHAKMALLQSASRFIPLIQRARILHQLQGKTYTLHSAAPRAFISGSELTAARNDDGAGGFSWPGGGLLASTTILAGGIVTTQLAQADAAKVAPQVPADPYAHPTDGLHGVPKDITLYQYEVCPFCCKVKAMLDYHKLPYRVVEVNPLTKGELSWSTYRKVPVIVLGEVGTGDVARGEVLVDSSAIMSRLAAELAAAGRSGNGAAGRAPSGWHGQQGQSSGKGSSSGMSAAEEAEWRKWVDARLVKVITANIYRSWDETWSTFKYITEQTTWAWGTREAARMAGAVLMWQIGKRMPAKYKIEGDLREALYSDLNHLVDSLKGQPFLGGALPNVADLSAFGVLRAVASTPTFADAMAYSKIKEWYERMEAAVGPTSCTNAATAALHPA